MPFATSASHVELPAALPPDGGEQHLRESAAITAVFMPLAMWIYRKER
jgi:hypothetical protein